VKINTRVHKVMDDGANPDHRAGPVPLREGVASTRVGLFGSVLVSYVILSFHHACGLAQGLRGARRVLRGCQLAQGRGKAGGEPYPQ
jgi:hypothetical protein